VRKRELAQEPWWRWPVSWWQRSTRGRTGSSPRWRTWSVPVRHAASVGTAGGPRAEACGTAWGDAKPGYGERPACCKPRRRWRGRGEVETPCGGRVRVRRSSVQRCREDLLWTRHVSVHKYPTLERIVILLNLYVVNDARPSWHLRGYISIQSPTPLGTTSYLLFWHHVKITETA
jgi:hypothetical protein